MNEALLVAVAAATGAAVMTLEVMAVRLMAPWFGQSQIVWTNVIAVVLAGLAIGQWLGGRRTEAQRGPSAAGLLFVAGAATLILPDIVRWLGPLVLPDDLTLFEAYPFVTVGSLLVAVLGMGLPMAALGAVTPWLVRLSVDATRTPGRVAGRILGAGTMGSLVGTFCATHLLLGWIGSTGAVRLAGGILILAGTALVIANRRVPPAAVLVPLLPLASLAIPAVPHAPVGTRILATCETPYQRAQVEEDANGVRWLRLNEGLDSFHSVRPAEGLWTGTYFDAFLYPALVAPRALGGRRSVLLVGLAAGTMARQILLVDPTARVVGMEVDAAIVELGRQFFDLPAETEVVAGIDARIALATSKDQYGAILLDAYVQQIYLPFHLCTLEFFELVRSRLLPGGVAALNISGLSIEEWVPNAVAGTFAGVFPGAVGARIPGTRNLMVLGWAGDACSPETAREALRESGVIDSLGWVVAGDLFGPVPEPELVLRDSYAPVEDLAHASWRGDSLDGYGLGGGMAVGRFGQTTLEEARQFLRWTRWSSASALLQGVVRDGHDLERGEALLLLGNLSYERHADSMARTQYDQVVALASTVPVAPEMERIVTATRDNLERLDLRVRRRLELRDASRRLWAYLWSSAALFIMGGTFWALRK